MVERNGQAEDELRSTIEVSQSSADRVKEQRSTQIDNEIIPVVHSYRENARVVGVEDVQDERAQAVRGEVAVV
jgi:hypothetical protein